jgi:hypothetical protein
MANSIDHFTLGASDLASGTDALKQTMGVEIPQGGKHPLMSTHNGIMATGDSQFMELIAIDPDAPQPDRIRWFSLDEARTIDRLAIRPRALCWVVNTDDLDKTVANSPVDLGEIVNMSRGDRTWRLTIPKDGSLPEQGLIPAFIEWSPGPHPSTVQQDLGIRLNEITLTHPDPAKLQAIFEALEIDHLATITEGETALSFDVNTPNGRVVLD